MPGVSILTPHVQDKYGEKNNYIDIITRLIFWIDKEELYEKAYHNPGMHGVPTSVCWMRNDNG